MKQFKYLEEAIAVLFLMSAKDTYMRPKDAPLMSLARHDYSPVKALSRQARQGIGYTDGQRELAVTLVTKYAKQWRKNGYDVSNINENTPTNISPRVIDNERRLTVDTERKLITLKFLYDPRLVSQLYNIKEARSAGYIDFDKETKLWELSITPEHIEYAKLIALQNKFVIGEEFKEVEEAFKDAPSFESIQLDIVDNELVLHNAPASMLEWIHDNIGQIKMDNFLPLAAAARTLAYAYSDVVVKKLAKEYSNFVEPIAFRESWIDENKLPLQDLLKLLADLKYKKIIIYTQTGPEDNEQWLMSAIDEAKKQLPTYTFLTDRYSDIDVMHINRELIILTNKVLPTIPDVIISLTGFMIGPTRRQWFQSASKNIFYCNDIDDKIKKLIRKNERNFNNQRRSECEDPGPNPGHSQTTG